MLRFPNAGKLKLKLKLKRKEKVYVTKGEDDAGVYGRVFALDAADRTGLWQFAAGGPVQMRGGVAVRGERQD